MNAVLTKSTAGGRLSAIAARLQVLPIVAMSVLGVPGGLAAGQEVASASSAPAASAPAAPAAPAAPPVEAAQCGDLLAIVRQSLSREIELPCGRAGAATCGERRRPMLAINAYIEQRAASHGDDCDTLLEVNRRLRALPPRR